MNKMAILIFSIILFFSSTVRGEEMVLHWKFELNREIQYKFIAKLKNWETTMTYAYTGEQKNLEEPQPKKVTESRPAGAYEYLLIFKPLKNNYSRLLIYDSDSEPLFSYHDKFDINSQGIIINEDAKNYDMLGLCFNVLFLLPENPVSVGSSWTRTIPEAYFNSGTKVKSRLLDFEKVNGYDCAKIEFEVYAEVNDKSNYPPAERVFGYKKENGVAYFAFKEGKFVKIDLAGEFNFKAEFIPGFEGDTNHLSTIYLYEVNLALKK